MNYKNILFDLDGTLTDPKEGITKSIVYALRSFGIEVRDQNTLLKFIGPPLRESFMKFYGFSETKAQAGVLKYREYFEKKGIYENKVYPGVYELLGALKKEGANLIIATSKPIPHAKEVLRYFDLTKYFSFVAGAELDGRRLGKDEVVAYAVDSCGLDVSRSVMVGDRMHDIMGAKKSGMDCIAVLYGYGDMEEFQKEGADRIVRTIDELKKLLLCI